jgi:ankyrin repeat protein
MSHVGWSKQELQVECTRRGLKTTGTKAFLVERLETNDELRAVKAAVSLKRKAVSEEEQGALDKQLRNVCKGGSLEAVRAALSSGANGNCVNENLTSPLMFACRRKDDWAVAEDIVRELLSCGSVVNSCDAEGWMAIHFAAHWSSCAVVTLLLEAKSIVDPRNKDNNTPLIACCGGRSDEEAVKIARVLLDRGAEIEQRGRWQRTPLLEASISGSAELVELLLSRGADIKAVDENGNTALILASHNGMHGPAIIPLLVKAGVDVSAVNSDGESALVCGMAQNGSIMQALAPLYPHGRQLANFRPGTTCPDPIGCVREAAPFGCSISSGTFDNAVFYDHPANYCWALLRLCGSTGANTFIAMEECQDASLWRLVGLEMLTTRDPDDDGTLLHVAAHTNNTAAVRELMAIWMNPLLRNREGRLAVELAADPVIRAELREYAVHSLNREVMRWYGPYLRQRVRTFLLVVQRWGATRVRRLPRDIVHMIIRRVMAVEYV